MWVANLAFTDNVPNGEKKQIGKNMIAYNFLGVALSARELSDAKELEIYHTPKLFHYLLSKNFDLFGLIEAGLAINKTKLEK